MQQIDVRCVLAQAVDEGIMKRALMKNVKKTPYYYFVETKPVPTEEKK